MKYVGNMWWGGGADVDHGRLDGSDMLVRSDVSAGI